MARQGVAVLGMAGVRRLSAFWPGRQNSQAVAVAHTLPGKTSCEPGLLSISPLLRTFL